MFNWLWKRLGYHVCEEFTQWARREVPMRRVNHEGGVIISQWDYVVFIQECQCTLCGRIEQRELPKG